MKKNAKKYPFFLIVDDGGFNYSVSNNKESKICMNTYNNILKLAKDFNIKIPICFTMKYLDKENISGVGAPLEYIDKLIDFLRNNTKYIEIGYHGLTHEYKGHIGEFYCLDINKPVPEEIQRDHIEKSKKIFTYWNFKFPEIFVPPYHAWEKNVTDRILSEYGVKYLVSYKKMLFNRYKYKWQESKYLQFLPRTSLGLNGSDYNLNFKMIRKIRFFPKKVLIDFVKCNIIPLKFFSRIRMKKSLFNNHAIHSYMTHIGNFSGQSIDFWREVLYFVRNNEHIYICKSNEDAITFYKK